MLSKPSTYRPFTYVAVLLLFSQLRCGGVANLQNSPDAFSFTDQPGVAVNTVVSSNAVTLTGSFLGLTAICNDSCVAISRNAEPFVAGSLGGFKSGDTIAIQVKSSAAPSKTVVGTVVLGRVTSGFWSVTTTANLGDPCLNSPAPGQVCADGTVYTGLSPDGNVPMFTTPCDFGQTWNGSSCTGTVQLKKFAWGTTIATGAVSANTGRANTALLFADNGNADGPYDAATFCKTLLQSGHNDWYLPAIGELNVLYTNAVAIGNFDLSGNTYWGATETGANDAQTIAFNNGSVFTLASKTSINLIRCVRRN